MARQSSIQIGQKYGRLTVIEKIGKLEIYPKRTLFLCICDCGSEKKIDAGNLKKPGNKSCGCLQKENARINGKKQRTKESYLNLIYGEYKRSAKFREHSFNISKIDFLTLIMQECFYCKSPPKMRKEINVGIQFAINGLDRQNNKIGYELENVASCCKICNMMKNTMNYLEFYEQIQKIAKALEYPSQS